VTTESEIITGTCVECGAPTQRDLGDARWPIRERLASLPLVCNDCAERAEREQLEAETERERREADARREARRRKSGIPAGLLGLAWDDVDHAGREDALDAAARWARGELGVLVLHGPVGVGKTRIAAVAANALLARRTLRWTSSPVLCARLGHSFGTVEREDVIDVLIGGHALVLDDLDKARPSEYAAEQLFAAIDTRLTEGVPLLATTNLGTRELQAKWPEPYGEAITSRLASGEAYAVGGHDRRLRQPPPPRGAHR
jgi:DNA replication protein DnaC